MVNGKKSMVSIHDHDGSLNDSKGRRQMSTLVEADCFMLCVACNDPASFESIDSWRAVIKTVAPADKPIFLILTKSDLLEQQQHQLENPIDIAQLREKSDKDGFQGAIATSAKEFENFNVHTAFNHVMGVSHVMKYE